MKLRNDYMAELGADLFADVPKSVLAAIAVSSLTLGGDYLGEARARLVTEWSILAEQGIVPQKVPAKYRNLITKEEG